MLKEDRGGCCRVRSGGHRSAGEEGVEDWRVRGLKGRSTDQEWRDREHRRQGNEV